MCNCIMPNDWMPINEHAIKDNVLKVKLMKKDLKKRKQNLEETTILSSVLAYALTGNWATDYILYQYS